MAKRKRRTNWGSRVITLCVILFFASLFGKAIWNKTLPGLPGQSRQPSRLSIAWMPETVLSWSDHIREKSDQCGVDPYLTAVVILCESCGNPEAVSPAGAKGLMQVMPYNAGEYDLNKPEENMDAGLSYLTRMYEEFGNWTDAITAYNAGPGNVRRETIPAEGKRFRRWVTGMWSEVQQPTSATFQAWWDAGGSHLCEKAESQASNGVLSSAAPDLVRNQSSGGVAGAPCGNGCIWSKLCAERRGIQTTVCVRKGSCNPCE